MADIDVERDGAVLEIRLNRADKRNAVTNAMYEALIDALEAFEDDRELRVAVLGGAGPDFSAGNDIADFVEPREGPLAAAALITLLPGLTKPLVAGVQGRAIGIGATILLHCDLVYVGNDLDLRFPFVDLGVVPEAGSTLLLPRLVGRVRAAQAMLLAGSLDATQAVAWGIANEVVEPDQVRTRAMEAAHALATKPPMALSATKALLRGDTAELADRIRHELEVFDAMLLGPEFAAAAERFLKRR
jgi:enoyl-CoA hydratase/carnithine racemase